MDYASLTREITALTEGIPHGVANLANASALIWQRLGRLNWAGFYYLKNNHLVLGPFQGKPACIEIPIGRGVCSTAVIENRSILVPDVHQFPGHIACDSASNSELVIPLRQDGKIIGVLDLDSPDLDRFTEEDRLGLEDFAEALCKAVLL